MTSERAGRVHRGEWVLAALSFVCFFCLLSTNYVLRPIRDAFGVEGGATNLALLFTGTFTVTLLLYPLLGALASRTTRTHFAAAVLSTIAASLLVFRLLLGTDVSELALGNALFVWVSVFNVLLTSLFWGVMADVFDNDQGRRLFGMIAAGGTAGALAGPLLTRGIVHAVGVEGMMLVAAGLMMAALGCVVVLGRLSRRATGGATPPRDPVIGGTIFAGLSSVMRSRYLLGIAAYILLLTTTATFVYFQQASIVESFFEGRAERTEFFATLDLVTNLITLAVQLIGTRLLVRRLGVTGLLVALPVITGLGFAALAMAPALMVLAVFQAMRRAGEYGLARPGREILFTLVSREDKFKAKNVVDVVVYRGGDAAVAWLNIGLTGAGLGVGATALCALPLCGVWAATGVSLGRMERRRRLASGRENEENRDAHPEETRS
jgi:AAA family ATP:ADP antiporter